MLAPLFIILMMRSSEGSSRGKFSYLPLRLLPVACCWSQQRCDGQKVHTCGAQRTGSRRLSSPSVLHDKVTQTGEYKRLHSLNRLRCLQLFTDTFFASVQLLTYLRKNLISRSLRITPIVKNPPKKPRLTRFFHFVHTFN